MAGMWNTIEPGKSTTGYDLSDLTNPQTTNVRKVTSTVSGDSEVVSEGDTSLFKESNEMGKDAFLNLLVTQLKYQDPLAPQADTQFVSQLAQFSSLETNKTMESALNSLSDNMNQFMTLQSLNSASTVNATSTSLLGKSVRMADSEIQYAGKDLDIKIQLDAGKKSAWVAIKDAQGNYLSYEKITAESGSTDLKYTWDGIAEDGTKVANGGYKVEILDESKMNSVGQAYIEGEVEGLRYTSDGAKLVIDGKNHALKDILTVDA